MESSQRLWSDHAHAILLICLGLILIPPLTQIIPMRFVIWYYPPVAFVIVNLIQYVFNLWGSWGQLADRYAATNVFPGRGFQGQGFQGQLWQRQHVMLRDERANPWATTVGVNAMGLYLSRSLMFGLLVYPPIFIPWSELSLQPDRGLMQWSTLPYVFSSRGVPKAKIWVGRKLLGLMRSDRNFPFNQD